MRLENLQLRDFRNYVNLDLEFAPGVNLIVGDNAQGKTNLLEAIAFLGTGKSFRAQKNAEMVRFEAEFADITGDLFSQERDQSLRWVLFRGAKPRQLYHNGVKKKAAGEIAGTLLKGLADLWTGFVDAGRNIVEGIWKGISNGLTWIKNKLKEWIGNVTDFIKNVLGIGSPSKLMRDEVGIYMAEGIGVGFENGMADVERTMRNSMPDFGELVGETTVPVSYVADAYGLNGIGAARGSGATINYGGVNIIIEGRGKDANELARELQIILNRKAASFA